jgi:hypothetical protein
MGTPDAQSVARSEARVADLRRECEAFLITEQRAHSDTLTDSATVKWHAMQRDLRQLETKAAHEAN